MSRVAKGADCKSAGGSLRRFESFSAHIDETSTSAFIAQSVEHTHGKGEVMGSNPIEGYGFIVKGD